VLRTSNISGTEFFCPHCDHMWSMDQSGTPRVLVVDDEPRYPRTGEPNATECRI
jgi:hypothetical protein